LNKKVVLSLRAMPQELNVAADCTLFLSV